MTDTYLQILWAVAVVTGAIILDRWYAPRWLALELLGDISYALYLTHVPAMWASVRVFGTRPFAFHFAVALFVAWSWWRYVEMPLVGKRPKETRREEYAR